MITAYTHITIITFILIHAALFFTALFLFAKDVWKTLNLKCDALEDLIIDEFDVTLRLVLRLALVIGTTLIGLYVFADVINYKTTYAAAYTEVFFNLTLIAMFACILTIAAVFARQDAIRASLSADSAKSDRTMKTDSADEDITDHKSQRLAKIENMAMEAYHSPKEDPTV